MNARISLIKSEIIKIHFIAAIDAVVVLRNEFVASSYCNAINQ